MSKYGLNQGGVILAVYSLLAKEAQRVIETDQELVLGKVVVTGAKIIRDKREAEIANTAGDIVVGATIERMGYSGSVGDIIAVKYSSLWPNVNLSGFQSYLAEVAKQMNKARPTGTRPVLIDMSPGTSFTPSKLSMSLLIMIFIGQMKAGS